MNESEKIRKLAEENQHLEMTPEIAPDERLYRLIKLLQTKISDARVFLDMALEEAILLTGSKIGYIYYYSEDTKKFTLNTRSKNAMDASGTLEKNALWDEVVRRRTPIIENNYSSLSALKNFMAIPIFSGEEIIAVIGMSNKDTGYTSNDVQQLSLFVNSIWGKAESIQAEAALRKNESVLKQSQRVAMLGHYEFDALTGNWTSSEMLDEIFGIDSGYNRDLTGWLEIIHPEDRSEMQLYLTDTVLKNGKPFDREYRVTRRKDKAIRWVHGLGQLIQDSVGKTIKMFGIIQDITVKKQSDAELEEKNHDLTRLVATKDKFFSIIAHDLKNPLGGIVNFTKSILQHPERYDTAKLYEFILLIYQTAETSFGLLENLLSWARTQTGDIQIHEQKINIAKIMKECMDVVTGNAALKELSFEMNIAENIFSSADPDMVKTILRNLLTNAVKFSNRNGRIIISAHSQNAFVQVSIEDNGTGMEPGVLNKLFHIEEKVSFSGTEGEKGSGLGLILCSELAEKQGGKVWAVSSIGKGSTFYLTLPVFSEE